ncbi:MAG: DUF1847 domain-containing protein [Candidatus Zixiibacteriota bacterium]
MRYGIPLLGNRVSPRCTIADRLLLVTLNRSQVRSQRVVGIDTRSWDDLVRVLLEAQVDTLICGGISANAKDELLTRTISVVDNVAGTSDEVLSALTGGRLKPGLGLQEGRADIPPGRTAAQIMSSAGKPKEESGSAQVEVGRNRPALLDCLACRDRVCLRGKRCDLVTTQDPVTYGDIDRRMIDSAVDIACEEDRTLCRLSELIYFCLDMHYHRLGLAFCIDLLEPAEILTSVLRRFFDVLPVCCKVGGMSVIDPIMAHETNRKSAEGELISCNPALQAELLNRAETDLNVIVGLCVGVDCVFTRASRAPVTTLFVKDKSLANNPIGAVYSDYYLKEATRSTVA